MQTFRIANLEINVAVGSPSRICYVLSPLDGLEGWTERAAKEYGICIATITGMDWDNDLTPWPAPGVPRGCPDFKGHARQFLALLTDKVIPEVETILRLGKDVERTLTGISLSGLFTLWQWILSDTFTNIISLSGSFWYEGFAAWVKSQPISRKEGRAYLLLGNQEAKTPVKAFQSVQTDTQEIVAYLHSKGIDDCFELVPGNHYQYGLQRLDHAFTWMFGARSATRR